MIPSWTISGVLPPLPTGAKGHETHRSPYEVDMEKVIDRFSITPARNKILRGLLDYRKALYDIGITNGFQWIDGSFMEDIEHLEARDPNDVDVVTFMELPAKTDQQSILQMRPQLFQPAYLKTTYHVDGYYMPLGEAIASHHVRQISYWYSMWSHRRDAIWKGFLQVPLCLANDENANLLLSANATGGVA